MGRVEELVRELCPEGVEWKSLGEVAECVAGATPKTSVPGYWDDGSIPWMSSGDVHLREVWDVEGRITPAGYDSCSTKMLPANTVVIALAGQGKTRGTVALVRFPLCTNQSLCGIVLNEDAGVLCEFLFHFLDSQYLKLRQISSGDGTRGGLNLKMIRSFEVPVPPLEVQQEIVRLLDACAQLERRMEDNLRRELDARKKQYEHYRGELLRIDSAVPTKPLEEVTVDRNGLRKPITKGNRVAGRTPYYGASGIVDYVEGYTHSGDFLLVSEDGANLRTRTYPIAFQIHGENWVNNHAHVLEIENPATRKLIEYYLNSISLEPYISGAAQPKLTKQKLSSIEIPFPELAVQEEIVAKLDALSGQQRLIESNLLRELDARKKQYEHYRDALLDLPRKAA